MPMVRYGAMKCAENDDTFKMGKN